MNIKVTMNMIIVGLIIFLTCLSCTSFVNGLMSKAKPEVMEYLSDEHNSEQTQNFSKAYDRFLKISNEMGIADFMNYHGDVYHGLRTITSDKNISLKESLWWCNLVNESLNYISLTDLVPDPSFANYQLVFGSSISKKDPHISEYKNEIPIGYGSIKFSKIEGELDILDFEVCIYVVNGDKSSRIFSEINNISSSLGSYYQSWEFKKKGSYEAIIKIANSEKILARCRFNISK
jgi:hypothetical protein